MASGTCVVACAVGGIPELIDDQQTGVLVAPGDPGALCDAVCGLLANPEHRRALERSAVAAVATRFTWERLSGQLESLFARLS
jgi:spore coat protein SA